MAVVTTKKKIKIKIPQHFHTLYIFVKGFKIIFEIRKWALKVVNFSLLIHENNVLIIFQFLKSKTRAQL